MSGDFDYKTIKFFGPLILIIRGLVRPIVTYAILYFDYILFCGSDWVSWPDAKFSLLKMANAIVFLFWFGDRLINSPGVQNIILNIIDKMVGSKKAE